MEFDPETADRALILPTIIAVIDARFWMPARSAEPIEKKPKAPLLDSVQHGPHSVEAESPETIDLRPGVGIR